MYMHAEIVMIGTEMLLGELVDTNANRLAKGLRSIGLDLYYKSTVGDNETRITEVLNHALNRSQVIITSGGLGPTVDDITRQAVANATGRRLVYSDELERQIAARFRKFGREMAENNKRQAYLPEGAIPLRNPVGTAPCFLSEDMQGRGFIISLPGVPRELQHMLDHVVLPILAERMGGAKVMKVRVLRTCAVGESNVDRGITDLMVSKNPTVGLAAHAGQTDVRITAKADTEDEADQLITTMEASLRERLGVAIYGVEQETVPGVVGQLLANRGLTLGIVDMLTSGDLAVALTVAGHAGVLGTTVTAHSLDEALTAVGLETGNERDLKQVAGQMAAAVAPEGGAGLVLLGPFEDEQTIIAVYGPDGVELVNAGRRFSDSDYVRRWFTMQGLDWVRRMLLGQLTSPVDWN
jgi:nicotinamide-nucleotide amidase